MRASYLLPSACWVTLSCMKDFLNSRLQGPVGGGHSIMLGQQSRAYRKDCLCGRRPKEHPAHILRLRSAGCTTLMKSKREFHSAACGCFLSCYT